MIWLASFPRSGNTFFRNVLYEVYGIESSTFHKETTYPVDDNYNQYQVVKTHLLPDQLEPIDPSIKSVYLVRDGRDALVSIAHHRKDLVAPNSDFQINLLEAIIAPGGSHFGGWSENVSQWSEKADIIIRFEDLINDPIKELEKLRSIMDLPEPQVDKLPTFKELKFGLPKYGSAKKFVKDESEQRKHTDKSFRKGKIGGYKDDMPEKVEQLFWDIHGDVMTKMNYAFNPKDQKNKSATSKKEPYKILIESNKILMPGNDGVKRYQQELLDGLDLFQNMFPEKWEIDLYIEGGKIVKLEERNGFINKLLHLKSRIKHFLPSFVYVPLSFVYRKLPIRYFLNLNREFMMKKAMEVNEKVVKQYDLVHVPLPQNFHFLKDFKTNFLVTIHDLTHKSFPEFHTRDNVHLTEKGMQEIINNEAHLIAISKSTKEDIIKEYPAIKSDSISVIYEACNRNHFKPKLDEDLRKKVLNKYNLPDRPYFLTLSTIEPRKNLINTIRAFKKLVDESGDQDLALFICGKKGWKTDDLFKLEDLSQNNVFFTGFVDEEDLPVFYSNALALCYVSIYEGFGLPPLESMACGTTVLYGDNSSMPEVIGDAGLAADPYDINDIALKMKRLLNKDVRTDLNSKSIKRAFEFSWLKTAWETLNLYEKCIETRNEKVN